MSPLAAMAIPRGEFKRAEVAAPPSPEEPGLPLPATVVMIPPETCTWICLSVFPTTPFETIRLRPAGSAAPFSSTASGGAIQKDPAPTVFPGEASPPQDQLLESFTIAYSTPACAA